MRVEAAFEYKREGDMFIVDFKHPPTEMQLTPFSAAHDGKVAKKADKSASGEISLAKGASESTDSKKYKGQKVTLDFDNAEIRHVFRLLAGVSGWFEPSIE